MGDYPQSVGTKKSHDFSVPAKQLQFATQSRRLIPWAVAGLGLFLIVGGWGWEYINSPRKASSVFVDDNSSNNNRSEKVSTGEVKGVNKVKNVKTIKIDIEGAVEKPGMIEIAYDSRIQDVLITAGGLTAKADRTYLSKNINLSQRVGDGMKIYIPAIGENLSNFAIASNLTQATTDSSLININTASPSELDKLPGVGPVTANKIISNRPYQEITDLVGKKAVSQSVFEKIKAQIRAF